MSHDPDRRLRTVLAVVGVAAGVANVILGTLLVPNAGGNRWLYAPVWGLPAVWAAGVLWLLPPGERKRYSLPWLAFAVALVAVVVTVAMIGGLVVRWAGGEAGWRYADLLFALALVFFNFFAWPAGLNCLGYLAVVGARRLWRMARDDTRDEAGSSDDTSARKD